MRPDFMSVGGYDGMHLIYADHRILAADEEIALLGEHKRRDRRGLLGGGRRSGGERLLDDIDRIAMAQEKLRPALAAVGRAGEIGCGLRRARDNHQRIGLRVPPRNVVGDISLTGQHLLVGVRLRAGRPGSELRAHCLVKYLEQAGVHPAWLNLGVMGIHGNGHMMMLEKNSAQIADVVEKWLRKAVSEKTAGTPVRHAAR
jgi:hypothetical protein